jgi:hypothetical protein
MALNEPEKRPHLPKHPGSSQDQADKDRRHKRRSGKPGRIKHFNDGKKDG